MLYQVLICTLILAFATGIQSIVGFGLALFAVPLLLLTGLPLLPSVFLVLCTSCLSSLLGMVRLRREIEFRKSIGASLLRLFGIFPGYVAAVYTVQCSPATIKAAIGFAIALGVVAQAYKMKGSPFITNNSHASLDEPSKKLAPWAFLSSGFFMGWLGMGGPPLVFWLLTGRQDSRKTRAFLFSVYVLTIPFQLAMMGYHTPETVRVVLPILALALPACLLVSSATLKIGDRLKVANLQKLSLILLSLLAAKSLFDWLHCL